MKYFKPSLWLWIVGIGALMTAAPVHAKGKLYIEVPGFTIGYHDYGHTRTHYNDRHHYYDRRYHHKRYKRHRHYKHHWRDRYRSDNYYYDDHYRDNRYSSGRYRSDSAYCPDPGYSRYRIDRSYCYRHKDHYHCE